MEKRVVNPWTWQERFGFQQATEVVGAERVLYCAGQTSVDGEGQPLHEAKWSARRFGPWTLGEAGARYASTLIGVTRLALPQLLVEIEATAVK